MSITKLRVNDSFTAYVPVLNALEPFVTSGSLRGVREFEGTGQLPAEHRDAVRAATVDYVVYSYATPIAWHDTVTGWTMPKERYSVTTSKQQGRIAPALARIGATV
jgi:hypothetical protein